MPARVTVGRFSAVNHASTDRFSRDSRAQAGVLGYAFGSRRGRPIIMSCTPRRDPTLDRSRNHPGIGPMFFVQGA